MAWPKTHIQDFVAHVTTIGASFLNQLQDGVNEVVRGLTSIAALTVDGVGGGARVAGDGDVSVSGTVYSTQVSTTSDIVSGASATAHNDLYALNGSAKIKNFISAYGAVTPSYSLLPGAGDSGTPPSCNVYGSSISGYIALTTGGVISQSGQDIVEITLPTSAANAIDVVISPRNVLAASLNGDMAVYSVATAANKFRLKIAVSKLSVGAAYQWTYTVCAR